MWPTGTSVGSFLSYSTLPRDLHSFFPPSEGHGSRAKIEYDPLLVRQSQRYRNKSMKFSMKWTDWGGNFYNRVRLKTRIPKNLTQNWKTQFGRNRLQKTQQVGFNWSSWITRVHSQCVSIVSILTVFWRKSTGRNVEVRQWLLRCLTIAAHYHTCVAVLYLNVSCRSQCRLSSIEDSLKYMTMGWKIEIAQINRQETILPLLTKIEVSHALNWTTLIETQCLD